MKLRNMLPCLLLLVPAIALAKWTTKAEEDIFTGGKKATMFATIGDYSDLSVIIFDCTKNKLSLSYAEKSSNPANVPDDPVDMVVKIDSGEIKKASAAFKQWNDQYIQAGFSDRDIIIQILKEASKAKTKMIVGLSSDKFGQHSVTVNVIGSSKAVSQFATACEIDIK
ncbi:hypothetical protein [Serratia fonticola]|uniref:hypothetical protein n=1 Tax=Serratia fonticola TaxID=47917 RepID=UPI002179EB7E|nr:hypothetical protein [Serratia fonticola]CAI1975530.1 Uncharacterised protein [Serratia fonticola]